MKSRPGWGPSARAQRGARRRSPTQPRLHRPQATPPARSATRRARRSVHAAPDAWPIASYHVACSPSRCPSRKSESGHRKPNSPYPTGHLLLNTPPTPALTADLGLTGARWGLQGAEAVLKLRAIRCNGDWDTYWTYHLAQERRRVHESRYADNIIPRAA